MSRPPRFILNKRVPPSNQNGDSMGNYKHALVFTSSPNHSVRRFGFLLFILVMTVLLIKLGMWQISRALEKEDLLEKLQSRQQQTIKKLANLSDDRKGYRIDVLGQFDVVNSLLLDNQIYQKRVGYRWIMPFQVNGQWLLVELGWIAAPARRDELPVLPEVNGLYQVKGVLDLPSRRMVLSDEIELVSWPWRVQAVDIDKIAKVTGKIFLPWIVRADTVSNDEGEYLGVEWNTVPVWRPVGIPPQKHYAYAMQWFGLTFVVLIGFLVWWNRGWV